MNFMFSLRSLLRYCSLHSNIKFISSRHHVMSFTYFLYPMIKILLLTLLEFEIKKKWHSNPRQRKYHRGLESDHAIWSSFNTLCALRSHQFFLKSKKNAAVRKVSKLNADRTYIVKLIVLSSTYGLTCAFSSAADQLYIARYSLWNRKLPSQSPILIPRWK